MAHIQHIQHSYLFSPLALLLTGLLSPAVFADDNPLEIIEVHGQVHNKHLSLGSSEAMLSHLGVDFSAAGGVSNLPILNGLMGDRVKVLVDGAEVTAACANQPELHIRNGTKCPCGDQIFRPRNIRLPRQGHE
jgi:iron complex outermembrane receptor protein